MKSKIPYIVGAGVILGLGIIILLPNFLPAPAQRGCCLYNHKTNLHALQTMVETYAVDWGKTAPQTKRSSEGYPEKIENLIQEAKAQKYWKPLPNLLLLDQIPAEERRRPERFAGTGRSLFK